MENAIIDPSASKEVAMTSLDWCARSRQLSLLKAVLSAHFSHCAISDLQRECALVLRHAVTSGCADTLTSLLRHVDDAFLRQRHEGDDDVREGRTRLERLLGLAVECGHRDTADVLVKIGADVNAAYRGKPLLQLSLTLGHHHVASLLIDHGADVSLIDSKGETPLFAAVSSGDGKDKHEVIDTLITKGADVNHRSVTGRQPIHHAALTSSSQTLTRLAEAGCDVSARDDVMGDTPLHLACSRCNTEAVVTLIQHGADLNSVNNQGQTPLRKLLQHATRVNRDFHHHSRMKLARVLIKLGFRLQPPGLGCSGNPSCSRNVISSLSPDRAQSYRSKQASCSFKKLGNKSKGESSSTNDLTSILMNSGDVDASSEDADLVCCCRCSWRRRSDGMRSRGGRDKVLETFQSLVREQRGVKVPGLQHLCRLAVRDQLPKVRFQENVRCLEVSAQLQQYLMFLPRLVDETLGWGS